MTEKSVKDFWSERTMRVRWTKVAEQLLVQKSLCDFSETFWVKVSINNKMPYERIKTSADTLVELIREKKGIKVDDAITKLDMDKDAVMTLARILQEHKILEIHYTLEGETILKAGENINKTITEEQIENHVVEVATDGEIEEAKCSEDVAELLRNIHERIFEKKLKEKKEE